MTQEQPGSRAAQQQFGRQAHMYAQSAVLRSGEGLDTLADLLSLAAPYRLAVDVGAGAGFTAFAIAPHTGQVLATDIAPQMLAQTRKLAAERGITNITTLLAEAETLPFCDASVDLVTCRHAAHHFHDLPQALAQIQRILKPGGAFIFADPLAPGDDYDDRWLNDVEVRRDPTHVRDYRLSEWIALLAGAGLTLTHASMTKVHLEFNDWVLRSGTPPQNVEPLRRDFQNAGTSVVNAFGIQQEGDTLRYYWDVLVARTVK
ncbi:MAG: methyltransferase domain-containing protein [Chloroflexi bacterium]|nr:methyltransferase domain-containing protein [Chloroflexota bacterium]